MINLIPPIAKKQMKREYWLRTVIVWLWLGNIALLIVAVLTAPSFVLVESQLQAYQQQMQSAVAVADEQELLSKTVREVNEQAAAITRLATVPAITPYLERIQALRGSSITLNTVSITRNETMLDVITVSGVASTRQGLTSFSQALVNDPLFVSADVPLANLAANENISFSIDIGVAPLE